MSAAGEQVLLVNARDAEESRVALAAGQRLEDLRWSQTDRESRVGDVYLATVRQVEPGLDAAFMDYGASRAGFLHVGNVHPGYADPEAEPFQVAAAPTEAAASTVEGAAAPAPPRPGIAALLRPGQRVIVQLLRDPVRGKGATLTTFVSLAGRLLVLMPSLGRLGVSRRIRDQEERERLRSVLGALGLPEGLGVIARTAAAASTRRDLRRDFQHLERRWRDLEDAARGEGPRLLTAEEPAPVRAVRDLFSPVIRRVVVDEPEMAGQVEAFLRRYAPRTRIQVEHHARSRPLFEHFEIERDYQMLFRARVPVGEGASIVIHETEALTAIDVNSGRIDEGSLEATALRTNLIAAEEVARQIRLRDLGGILVVDFIDMTETAHRKEVEARFRKALRHDRARLKPGRLGSFGLMPLTRRRLGTGLPRTTEWLCRHCGGTGTTAQHRAGAMRVLRRLRAAGPGARGRLRAHPGVLEVLAEHHAPVLAELGGRLEQVADPQVPPGEPVLDGMGPGA